MDLLALSDFHLIAAHGGIGQASRVSRRSKATLSRHVAELERSLGVRLFERGPRSIHLTEEGRRLYERTQAPLSDIAEAGEAAMLGASSPRGRLRVSAPIVFAHVALARLGARFALAYPEVQLEIIAEDRKVDPVEDGYDLIIRVDPAPDDQLVGRRFLDDERLLVGPPHIPLPSSSDGGEVVMPVVLLATPNRAMSWQITTSDGEHRTVQLRPVLTLSSLLMVREAALAGAGAALLPKMLVAEDIAAGRLTHWGTQAGKTVELWVLQSSRRLIGAKVRAFLEVLEQAFPNRTFIQPR